MLHGLWTEWESFYYYQRNFAQRSAVVQAVQIYRVISHDKFTFDTEEEPNLQLLRQFFFLKTLTNPDLDFSDKSRKLGSTKPQNKTIC